MDNKQIVKIDLDDLCELVRDSIMLNNLYANGVDNWDGYEYTDHPTDDEVDDYIENLIVYD